MNFRTHAIAVAAGLLCAGASTWAATEVSGKRIDNGRIDLFSVPPPAEKQPAIAYPMPSGVTREEAASMRSLAAQVPASPAQVDRSLQEINGSNLFVSGKAELTPEARAVLDSMAAGIGAKAKMSSTTRIAVVGHTDNQRLAPETKRTLQGQPGLVRSTCAGGGRLSQTSPQQPRDHVFDPGRGRKPTAGFERDTRRHGPQPPCRIARVVPARGAGRACAAPAAALPPCTPQSVGQSTVPFRITIDGEPINTAEIPNRGRRPALRRRRARKGGHPGPLRQPGRCAADERLGHTRHGRQGRGRGIPRLVQLHSLDQEGRTAPLPPRAENPGAAV